MSRKRPIRAVSSDSEDEDEAFTSDDDETLIIPNAENSGSSDSDNDSDNGSDKYCDDKLPKITYKRASKSYHADQGKLEKNHEFEWVIGERIYSDIIEDKILFPRSTKDKILQSEPIELFETFFSIEMKQYIIDASKENGFDLSLVDLNTFIGIVITSSFNKRKSQRDYWSTDPFLSCEVISSAMSRRKFESIKSNLKFSKAKDNDSNDKGWRVRVLLKLFQKNIMKFGFWRSALSVDEMMAKSFARTCLKQFIRGKPTRFGLKFWGLCTADGYLLNIDLYCGKNSAVGDKLAKCALGSRVVLNLLKPFFELTADGKISLYHLYFDNYFTNLDLVVHLKRLKLKCTGTVRDNRVAEKNTIDKKSPRGTYAVKHDKNSGINYITTMDSKPVSILSTAAGVTPLLSAKRYSSIEKAKIEIPVPQAFHLYNKFMGGVDQHDGHCSNLSPSIRSKKWTWVVFIRLIQAAITNSVVIFNAATDSEKKVGSKEFAMSIAKSYIHDAQKNRENHKTSRQNKQKKCSNCPVRTYKFCENCNLFFCSSCMTKNHSNI